MRIANGFCDSEAYFFVDDLQIVASTAGGGGAINALMRVTPAELLRVTAARVVHVVEGSGEAG